MQGSRWLPVFDALLDLFDVIFDVAIGDENIRMTVQIVIKEKTGEAKRQQAGMADLRPGRFVNKQSISFIVVKGHHLAIEAIARTLQLRIQRLAVHAPADFDAVFLVMTRQKVDAVTMVEDAMVHSSALRVVDAALKGRVPAVVGLSSLVEAGGFMSYGPNRADLWRKAALLTDKILRGAKPGDLPIEQPTKFELVINLKTAKALGLPIPPTLLARADEVIE